MAQLKIALLLLTKIAIYWRQHTIQVKLTFLIIWVNNTSELQVIKYYSQQTLQFIFNTWKDVQALCDAIWTLGICKTLYWIEFTFFIWIISADDLNQLWDKISRFKIDKPSGYKPRIFFSFKTKSSHFSKCLKIFTCLCDSTI